MLLEIKVKPSSAEDKILNFREPAFLEIAFRAKAEINATNQSLCQFLAKRLEISPENIKIIKRKKTKKETFLIDNFSFEDLKRLQIE